MMPEPSSTDAASSAEPIDTRPDAPGQLPDSPWVKIDGLREPEHAEAAAAAGADLLGFIFAPGRRQVTPERARACIEAARAAPGGRRVVAVGVFVDADPAEISAVAVAAGLDLIQLHGDESPDVLAVVDRPVIKAIKPQGTASLAEVSAAVERFRGHPNEPIRFLIDGYSPDAAGGTGARADWRLAARLAAVYPIILAGGLSAGNVRDAIAAVRPLGVDVSSGVEIEGRKDGDRIRAFVGAAREGFAAAYGRPESPPSR